MMMAIVDDVDMEKVEVPSYDQMTDDELSAVVAEKMKSLRRVRAKRDELNQKVRKLKDELEEIMDPGCYVGEVIKMMDREKVLVKVRRLQFH